jgi:hypothetical protein
MKPQFERRLTMRPRAKRFLPYKKESRNLRSILAGAAAFVAAALLLVPRY